jgi:O-methyltransferase
MSTDDGNAARYLDLLKRCLTRSVFDDGCYPGGKLSARLLSRRINDPDIQSLLERDDVEIVFRTRQDPDKRAEGLDWPLEAETMIGEKRMDNLHACIAEVVRDNVPGDLLEAGVWRGGATIFMRAMLTALGDETRNVWVVDSFQGLPKPDADRYPADRDANLWQHQVLAVPIGQVRANFTRYGLLDDRVKFVQGWFRDTLPSAPVDKLAVLRLDGDLYESTILALDALYPKLSTGGFVIIDDYILPFCRQAVVDYRTKHSIIDPIVEIDRMAVFWKKSA